LIWKVGRYMTNTPGSWKSFRIVMGVKQESESSTCPWWADLMVINLTPILHSICQEKKWEPLLEEESFIRNLFNVLIQDVSNIQSKLLCMQVWPKN
jgi:hypothetical protein